jgi:hypothetical protein
LAYCNTGNSMALRTAHYSIDAYRWQRHRAEGSNLIGAVRPKSRTVDYYYLGALDCPPFVSLTINAQTMYRWAPDLSDQYCSYTGFAAPNARTVSYGPVPVPYEPQLQQTVTGSACIVLVCTDNFPHVAQSFHGPLELDVVDESDSLHKLAISFAPSDFHKLILSTRM